MLYKPITKKNLNHIAEKGFGNFVKAVVDVKKGIMVIDADLHADEEALLLQNRSKQNDLWGINLYPQLTGDDVIEFDSMINLRPGQNNLSHGIVDPKIQDLIRKVVKKLIV